MATRTKVTGRAISFRSGVVAERTLVHAREQALLAEGMEEVVRRFLVRGVRKGEGVGVR